MKSIMEIWKKHKDMILYVFFGGVTTVVNQAAYMLCYDVLGAGNLFSTAVAWVLAVVIAYITNKLWVFDSRSFSAATLKHEIPSFFGARVFTGLLDMGIMYLAVDVMVMNGNVWKLLSNIVVIILNYFASKLLVFRKK